MAFCSGSSNNNLQLLFISRLLTLLAAMTLHSLSFNYKNINSSSSVWWAGYSHMTTKIWFSSVITVIYLFIFSKWSPCYVTTNLLCLTHFFEDSITMHYVRFTLCVSIHPLDLLQTELGVGFGLLILMSESMKYHLCTTAQPCSVTLYL